MIENTSIKVLKFKNRQDDLSFTNTNVGFSDLPKSLDSMNDTTKNDTNELLELKQALDAFSLVSVTDPNGTITYVNDNFCKTSKYSKEELIGQNHRILKSGFHSKQFFKKMWDVISCGKNWQGIIKNMAKDGSEYWVKMSIIPICNENGDILKYISVRADITEERKLLNDLESSNYELANNEKIIKIQMDELKIANDELANNEKIIKNQIQESIQRYSLEKELMESKARLESEKKFAEQKDEFSAMVSHELKTPLFPIKMHCEMLKDPSMLGKLSAEQLESVNEIELMTDKLNVLTGDIFDASKLDMNKMQYTKKKFRLCEFMDKIIKDNKSFTEKKHISLTMSVDDLEIYTDHDRLSQVLTNLIINAVDFTPENTGKIQVDVKCKDKDILFSVKDNGTGIDSEMLPHLFRKFYQVDTALKRKHGGTGLGLAICKGIVTDLGGKIWVNSKKDSGTTFFFTIPKISPHDYIIGSRNPRLGNAVI